MTLTAEEIIIFGLDGVGGDSIPPAQMEITQITN